MSETHILVDFENVQPSAADIGLMRGETLRLAIFRGPGQMKYAADVAEAWQPLGANLTFVRCAKAGRNAVDMHIAFYLGALVAAYQRAGGAKDVRFVVVSRDTDFDPLLMHVRSQGFDASRAASIAAALGGPAGKPLQPAAKAAKAGAATARNTATKKTAAKKAAAKSEVAKTPTARSAAAKETSAKNSRRTAAARKAPSVPSPAKAAPAATSPAKGSAADARTKVIESLQRMGDKRPAKRKGLERHIESHLGRKLDPMVLPALMQQLEREGVLAFTDNKVEYRLPKTRK